MYFYNENESITDVRIGESFNHHSIQSTFFSALSGEIRNRINQHHDLSYYEYSSQHYPTEAHEDPGVLDYHLSYYSAVPIGYSFVRGPNVYASEFAGTTYYLQEAIPVPVLSHEHPDVIGHPISSVSAVPVEYQFIRGPNIYSSEIAGTTFFVQEAIPIEVLSSSEIFDPSDLSAVSHPSSPKSSDVMEHENIESSTCVIRNSERNVKVAISKEQIHSVKCKEVCQWEKSKIIKGGVKSRKVKVKQRVNHTCSMKTEVVCISELNEKEKTLIRHKSSVEKDESSNIELNKKIKQKPESVPAAHRKSDENINYVTYAYVLKSHTHRSAEKSADSKNSSKTDKMYNIKENKVGRREIKKIIVKVTKLEENKKSVVINEICKSESIEKVQQTDENIYSANNYELCDLAVSAKCDKLVEDKLCVRRFQDCNLEANKISIENEKNSTTNEVSNMELAEKIQKSDINASSVKHHEVCNLESSKTTKRKCKKRKIKIFIKHECSDITKEVAIENKNSAKSNDDSIAESHENLQKLDRHKTSVERNGISNLEMKEKIKRNTKKSKRQDKKSEDDKNAAICVEDSNLYANANFNKSDESKNFVKDDNVCTLGENKKNKRKVKKRNMKVSKSDENEKHVNSSKSINSESYGKFQQTEENKRTVKNNDLCSLDVNVKDKKYEDDKVCVGSSENLNLEENTTKAELEKKKTEFEKSVENKNLATTYEAPITKLRAESKNADEYETSVKPVKKKCKKRKTKVKINIEHECTIKADEVSIDNNKAATSNEICCTQLKENFQKLEDRKSTVKPHELCNLQDIKTHKRKIKKRKKRGKKLVEHTSLAKYEAPNSVLNENINKRHIQNEECDSEVNEEIKQSVEHKRCLKSQQDSNFDANKKKEKVKKSKAKDAITLENKTVKCEKDSDLNSSNRNLVGKEEMRLSSTEADNFSKNNEGCSIVESYDRNKIIDNFQDINITSQYVREYNVSKAIRDEEEKRKCNFSRSIETFHSNTKAFVELSNPKEVCVDEKYKLNEFYQNLLTSNDKALCNKTDEFPTKKYHVPSQESNYRADVPVAVSEFQNEDLSLSAAPIEVEAVKKKRFKRLRKWFNGIFCCVRKNKE